MEARHVSEENVRGSYHDVKLLAADERLLLAQALWVKVDAFLQSRGTAELGMEGNGRNPVFCRIVLCNGLECEIGSPSHIYVRKS